MITESNEKDIARMGKCVGMTREEMLDTLEAMDEGTKMGIISVMIKSHNYTNGKCITYWTWPMTWDKIDAAITSMIDNIKDGEWIKVKDTMINPSEVVSIRPNIYREKE